MDKLKYSNDKLYTYAIPERLKDEIKLGCRVLVPFGASSSVRIGAVTSIANSEKDLNLKKIYSVLDLPPLLNEEMISLATWMKEKYFCTFFDAIKAILPPGIDKKSNFKFKIDLSNYQNKKEFLTPEELKFINEIDSGIKARVSSSVIEDLLDKRVISLGSTKYIGEKILKYIRLKDDFKSAKNLKLTKKQKSVIEFLLNHSYSSIKEICYFTGCTEAVIKNLAKKGIVEKFEKIEKNNALEDISSASETIPINLTDDQNKIYKQLSGNFGKSSVHLLYGVTGSGKTLIILKLIDYALSLNKSIIYMVPEICLTSQVKRLFKSRYSDNVAIMHSGLSNIQRFEEWKRIKSGKVKIVVGTRTSVFSPVDNLGLIIIDEEQDQAYKSEFNPRFNAKDIAKFRSKYSSSMLVLCSATPSIESYFLSKKGKYELHEIEKRYNNLSLPKVEIVDMNSECQRGNAGPFSLRLIELIGRNLDHNEQSVILINRRGYHTFARCKECGEVLVCHNCNISLNYHLDNRKLMCHYCGYSTDFIKKCLKCGDTRILYSGLGTQKAKEKLNDIFPKAKILRADSDAMISQKNYESLFGEFAKGNYDIMIGTQMVAKGFNFPKVTLVGVLSADSMLWNDDFRSYEKAFSLITQVIGRSGRDSLPGIALIQSYDAESEVIKLAAKQNYKEFYNSEIAVRKTLLYPPFCDICLIGFTGKKEVSVKKYCEKFFEILCDVSDKSQKKLPLRIFRPTAGNIKKVGEKYRYKIVMKCKENKEFRKLINETFEKAKKSIKINGVSVFIDINPESIL